MFSFWVHDFIPNIRVIEVELINISHFLFPVLTTLLRVIKIINYVEFQSKCMQHKQVVEEELVPYLKLLFCLQKTPEQHR